MSPKPTKRPATALPRWRPAAILAGFALLAMVCVYRAVDLQVNHSEFLQGQGSARHLRVVEMPAHRGAITDRHGASLAISAPVDSVWANPGELLQAESGIEELARQLGKDPAALRGYLVERAEREFVYIERHLNPDAAAEIMALGLPGVALQREYRRFYPAGEVTGHVLGFTNIDDRGQEGLELAYNDWLSGTAGAKRVVKDRLGRVIADVERLREPEPGKTLKLSIDRRLQYLAYRELKAARQAHDAKAASLVLLNPETGEVLAMVNQPAFNPNNRADIDPRRYRNRAVTDAFEPGSTAKPFTVAAAMEHQDLGPASPVDTRPGVMRVGGNTIRDHRNYGRIDVATVLKKSSNVGAAKLALGMDKGVLWRQMRELGFGQGTASAFPGEASGAIASRPPGRGIERATLAFGYGVAVTPLQLASGYAAIANDGSQVPVTFLKRDDVPGGTRVLEPRTAKAVRKMLEAVVEPGGTATAAQVDGYRIAGKTGTVKKSIAGGYAEDRYAAWFAGMAPASDPKLVAVVLMDEPQGEEYYGGQVAAPVFARVMEGALRLMNVPPDDMPEWRPYLAAHEGGRP